MIIAERKPIDEIREYIAGCQRVLVLGCGTCVTECAAGGEREVAELASLIRLSSEDVEVLEKTINRQCDAEFCMEVEDLLEHCDAVLSMACGVGVQMLAKQYPDKRVYPGLNTQFMGTHDGAGEWTENCLACGDCKLGEFGGVCPVTRCSKSLLNGPCGGSSNGKCEVDPENIDCGWQLIHDRLKALGRLDSLSRMAESRDWSTTHSGGVRKLSREDVARM